MSNHHTSGKWSLHPHQYDGIDITSNAGPDYKVWSFHVGSGEKIVAEVSGNSREEGGGYEKVNNREEILANAKLIAAAPDMLELLERIVEQEPPIEWWETRRLARQILKKIQDV